MCGPPASTRKPSPVSSWKLRQTAVQDLSVTDTTVTGTIQAPRDGLVFTSIPYDKGWRAVIDGKTVEPVKVGDAFLAYPVAAGEHQMSLRFIPMGWCPARWYPA